MQYQTTSGGIECSVGWQVLRQASRGTDEWDRKITCHQDVREASREYYQVRSFERSNIRANYTKPSQRGHLRLLALAATLSLSALPLPPAMPGPSGTAGGQEGVSSHEPGGEYGTRLSQPVLHAAPAPRRPTQPSQPARRVTPQGVACPDTPRRPHLAINVIMSSLNECE